MVSLARRNNESRVYISPEIAQMIDDGQRLIRYIVRNGEHDLEPALAQSMINAKYKIAKNEWSEEDEQALMLAYDQLARAVYPVTVETINAVIPHDNQSKGDRTKAEWAVLRYRWYALFTLLLLVVGQVYWLFGNDLRNNLQTIFQARETTSLSLLRTQQNQQQTNELSEQLKIENQRLDANYKLLLQWNKVWSLGGSFELSLPTYFKTDYELKKKRLIATNASDELDQLELQRSLHEVRIVFFENIQAADFVLGAFQNYLLPLLYGLLGALIFVLRELSREIKQLTYGFDSEIRFRLRLTLGALGGLIIGWLLRIEDSTQLASLSPMALAFLVGYNVEILFALMDKLIDNMREMVNRSSHRNHDSKQGTN